MDNYLNKKVEIREKMYNDLISTYESGRNTQIGIITNIINSAGKIFIELDNKILINTNYIYKIEIID